jgi:predicted ester cyclase
MTVDEKKALARRALEMWASDNNDKPEDVFSADYLNHQEPDVAGGVTAKDLAAWKELVGGYLAAFSPSTVRILMQVGEGDLVATRWEITGVHTGTFVDTAPTGNKVTWTGIAIDRFENGKIAESWIDWDKYRFLQGIGQVP